MRERVVEVVNELGLHARAAARLGSILGVLLLGAGHGARLTVRCRGEDEQAAMDALCELVRDRFGEEA